MCEISDTNVMSCFSFLEKCSKSDIKLTRARIEIITKKRNATQKYLRNDVADLLRNGSDTNAFNRVIISLSLSLCLVALMIKFWLLHHLGFWLKMVFQLQSWKKFSKKFSYFSVNYDPVLDKNNMLNISPNKGFSTFGGFGCKCGC